MSDVTNADTVVSAVDAAHRRQQWREPVLDPLASVAREHGEGDLADRLLELKAFLVDDLTAIEQAMSGIDAEVRGVSTGDGILARQAARHLLDRPGKRIRPLCVLLAARLGNRQLDPVVRNLAVACELVHAATLLHDDVLDQGDERRGAPTSRLVYGNSASILGGDHLLVEALKLVEVTGYPPLLRSLLGVISEMVHAEAIQLEQRRRFRPEREIYLRVIHGKTAALFRWGLAAGGAVADVPGSQLGHLARVGDALGMAFQLIDDVLDLTGDAAVTGKTPIADLREGKLTWPVIIACEKDVGLARDLERFVRGDDSSNALELVQRIRESGAVHAARAFAEEQGATATAELAHLPPSPTREAIGMVVRDAIRRSR
jgi:octaprenyl-diphosphate synthase